MQVAVLFADGFEEIEAVTPVDVLYRAGLGVLKVGVSDLQVRGSHGITIQMDCLIDDIFVNDFCYVLSMIFFSVLRR